VLDFRATVGALEEWSSIQPQRSAIMMNDVQELTADELNAVIGGNINLGGPIKFDAKAFGEACGGVPLINTIVGTAATIVSSIVQALPL
jgi:bacteriocin-like protein